MGGDGTGSSSGPATTSSSSGPESSRKGLASGPPAPPRVDDTGHAMTAPLIVPKLRAPAKIVDTVLPTSCLEWALQHCERWLHMRDNEDIDWPDQNVRPSLRLHLLTSCVQELSGSFNEIKSFSCFSQANLLSEQQWKQLFDWHKMITQ